MSFAIIEDVAHLRSAIWAEMEDRHFRIKLQAKLYDLPPDWLMIVVPFLQSGAQKYSIADFLPDGEIKSVDQLSALKLFSEFFLSDFCKWEEFYADAVGSSSGLIDCEIGDGQLTQLVFGSLGIKSKDVMH